MLLKLLISFQPSVSEGFKAPCDLAAFRIDAPRLWPLPSKLRDVAIAAVDAFLDAKISTVAPLAPKSLVTPACALTRRFPCFRKEKS